MKNIIILLLITIAHQVFAQSFPDLIKQYETECAQIVPDTIPQYGIVTCSRVPVRDRGKVIAYTLANPDTVWQACKCKEYKEQDVSMFWGSGLMRIESVDETGLRTQYIESTTEKIKLSVNRTCICQVKLRKPEPWSEDFWEWLRKQNQ